MAADPMDAAAREAYDEELAARLAALLVAEHRRRQAAAAAPAAGCRAEDPRDHAA